MILNLFRYLSRKISKRALDAASDGRRWRDDRRGIDSASLVHGGAAVVAARAYHFALNTPEGTRITDSLVANLVGTGITPRPQHTSPAVRDYLASSFLGYTDVADADGRHDLYGLMSVLVRDMVVSGESLTFISFDPMTGAPQYRRLHPEQLDRSKSQNLKSAGRITQGVEFNATGKIVAYWIRPNAPGEALAGLSLTSIRYPASAVIHMFRQLVPGQVRGLSWFAPILLSARDLDALLDAMLVRAKVSAMYVGSLYDPDGTAGGMEGEQTDQTLDTTAEPGTIRVETGNGRLDWSDPPDSGDTVSFSKGIHRRIASGVGVTYEQATGDYSQVNYSSARAALLEFRRFAEGVQHHTIIHQLCRPIWDSFIHWQVLTGSISAAAYQRNRMQFHAVKWLPPAWQWVDPEKDAKAAVLEMDNLIRSRSEIVAERGYDIEALDR
ncbi:MAG: phage portal protein, partial [Hyphomicrobiales bacterium]|nr:phage portal protein [Hyphomicrobiales bacterium]